ncbi:MAG: aminopeptidase P family protein [candidate division KSB1 bacterium]|nr:aminopeptidase P family protein [candidate division KSB1 bacterium]
MFEPNVYVHRRKALKKRMGSGLLLFLGNDESPMNYRANTYQFRQDSTFLYYWGLDFPGLAALIDVDADQEVLFGDDYGVDDIVWMGPQPSMAERAAQVGVDTVRPLGEVEKWTQRAIHQGQRIHFLPQYRSENQLKLEQLTGVRASWVNTSFSREFVRAVVAQRSVKSAQEVAEIEKALDISYEMYQHAVRTIAPGLYEREVAGTIDGLVWARGSAPAFPTIFTVHGEILHGHSHENLMQEGQLVVFDSGAESPCHYASDITRTYPVSGTFTPLQKDIYEVVLAAQQKAIAMMAPGVPNREAHLAAARVVADGMRQLGFMKGDPQAAVEAGAHALFFPHGLGHMLGLDVHDMENLGEDFVGYDEEFTRSEQFGLAYLRLAKRLQPGFVVTVEPGIYFIPELVAQWKANGKHRSFINYDRVERHLNFGGIRIEEDVLITRTGHRVLGKPIPKTVNEIEACMRR